jgi:hypothetical protein
MMLAIMLISDQYVNSKNKIYAYASHMPFSVKRYKI